MLSTKLLDDPLAAEMATLGCILHDSVVLPDVRAVLSPRDFQNIAHRDVYELMLEVYEDDPAFDALLLFQAADARGLLERISSDRLAEMADTVRGPGFASHYARVVRKLAVKRRTAQGVAEVQEALDRDDEDAMRVLRRVLTEAEESAERATGLLGEGLEEAFEQLTQEIDLQSGKGGFLPWRIRELDATGCYLRPGAFCIVAGSPGAGKSWFVHQWALDTARLIGPVIFVSLEMTRTEIQYRSLLMTARVKDPHVNALQGEDLLRAESALHTLRDLALFVPESVPRRIGPFEEWVRGLIHTERPAAFVIDYLGLLAGDGENATAQVASVSTTLRTIAKDTEIPFVVIHSMNRGAENEKRPPEKRDLRQSGQIEFDATNILFLYRPWDSLTKAQQDMGTHRFKENDVWLIQRKCRGGPQYAKVEMKQITHRSRIEPVTRGGA